MMYQGGGCGGYGQPQVYQSQAGAPINIPFNPNSGPINIQVSIPDANVSAGPAMQRGRLGSCGPMDVNINIPGGAGPQCMGGPGFQVSSSGPQVVGFGCSAIPSGPQFGQQCQQFSSSPPPFSAGPPQQITYQQQPQQITYQQQSCPVSRGRLGSCGGGCGGPIDFNISVQGGGMPMGRLGSTGGGMPMGRLGSTGMEPQRGRLGSMGIYQPPLPPCQSSMGPCQVMGGPTPQPMNATMNFGCGGGGGCGPSFGAGQGQWVSAGPSPSGQWGQANGGISQWGQAIGPPPVTPAAKVDMNFNIAGGGCGCGGPSPQPQPQGPQDLKLIAAASSMESGPGCEAFVEVSPEISPNFTRGSNGVFILEVPTFRVKLFTKCNPEPPSMIGRPPFKPYEEFALTLPDVQQVIFDPVKQTPPNAMAEARATQRGEVLEVPTHYGIDGKMKANSPYGTLILEDYQTMGGMKQKVGETKLDWKLQTEGQLSINKGAGDGNSDRLELVLQFTFQCQLRMG